MSKIICQFDMLEDRQTLREQLERDFRELVPAELEQITDAVVSFIESRDLKAGFFVFDRTQERQALSTKGAYTNFDEARKAADEYHRRQAAVSDKTQATEVLASVCVHKRRE